MLKGFNLLVMIFLYFSDLSNTNCNQKVFNKATNMDSSPNMENQYDLQNSAEN